MNIEKMKETLIELSHVTVAYDSRDILHDIDLSLYKGDFMAITGPNGGGKTTLLRTMLKLLKPTSGKVTYFSNGHPVRHLRIGYLPQKSKIDTKFPITVEQTVKSGQITGLLGHRYKDADRKFAEIVELCGIGGYLDRNVGDLSGGQLQRTLLARALATKPEILVLDEPLSYVDKKFELQIYSIMEELAKKITVVLVSHEMSVISGMATRHVIVDGGRLHFCHSKTHYVSSSCD